MNMVRFAVTLGIVLSLTYGCSTTQPLRAIDVNAISDVQANIKRQIGIYMEEVQALRAYGEARDAQEAKEAGKASAVVLVNNKMVVLSATDFACGAGRIDFRVSAIKAELTTSLDKNSNVKFGLTIPVLPVTLGPSVAVTNDTLNTQTLDYNLWPLATVDQEFLAGTKEPSTDELKKAPIAVALLDLRNALILAATKVDYKTGSPRGPLPCFTDYNPGSPAADAGNSFKLQLQITFDPTAGLTVGIPPLTAGATVESKSVSGNTLTVTFLQRGVKHIQMLRDQATKDCAFPYDGKLTKTTPPALPTPSAAGLCVIATEALGVVTAPPAKAATQLVVLKSQIPLLCKMESSEKDAAEAGEKRIEKAEKNGGPPPPKPGDSPTPKTPSACDQAAMLAKIAGRYVQEGVGFEFE
jgi:hypothetical protein